MTEGMPPVSETAVAVEIFRPLWALVTVGAVASAHAAGRAEFTLADYIESQRGDLNRLLDIVRAIGGLSPDAMHIFEAQGGWSDGHVSVFGDVDAELLMYAGFIEEFPPDLDDPIVLRRMLSAATDLQLAILMDSLVDAAVAATEPAAAASWIIDAVGIATRLAYANPAPSPLEVFRLWRVAFVPDALRPDSVTPKPVQVRMRLCMLALEAKVSG